jgi:hypothetical protein
MKLYRAYGLILACERELPFAAADQAAETDVTVLDALGQAPAAPSPELYRELRRNGDSGWSLRYRNSEGGWLHFDHDAGAKILTVAGSLCWSDAVPVLAGVACAVLLSSAGTPILHGAGVALEGGAVGILGDSGQGKSTLAGALLKAGGLLLSEDLLAFTRRGSDFAVEPGYARISLLPDARHALGFEGVEGSAVQRRNGTAKCWIGAAAAAEPVAIRHIYILAPPDPAAPDGRAERLSRSAAAPALVRHLYGAPWIRPVRETDLAFCGSLAAEVPVFTLSRPASLGRAEACATMLRDG